MRMKTKEEEEWRVSRGMEREGGMSRGITLEIPLAHWFARVRVDPGLVFSCTGACRVEREKGPTRTASCMGVKLVKMASVHRPQAAGVGIKPEAPR